MHATSAMVNAIKAVREMFSLIHRRDEYRADKFAHIPEDAGNEVFGQAIIYAPSTLRQGILPTVSTRMVKVI
jgi:hypothetical protein